jgi:hypothetical protein
MDNLLGYVITGIVTFAVGYALKFFEPKSKIVWWSPHIFPFTIPNPPNPDVQILTHAITVQNLGRRAAESIEITHQSKPDFFKLEPALDYEEDYTPAKEHIVRIPHLAPKDFFTIEFLNYVPGPRFLGIRSSEGKTEFIAIQPQRIYPKWVKRLSVFLLYVGAGFVIYWLVRAVYFVSTHF